MKVNNIELEKINKTDLSGACKFIDDQEAANFFNSEAGKEHYKLLAYLSLVLDNIEISDIGTYKGCSALALSCNPSNKVYSYDISDMNKVIGGCDNIEFRIIKESFSKDILKSKLICLDTIHDGIHEKEVLDFLIKNNWKGILILDDIHHYPEQNKLWNSIKLRKEDITHLGHWSGTGIIYFE